VFFAVNSHARAASTEMGMIIYTVKQIKYAIFFGYSAKKTAHKIKPLFWN
jgi:hypothetical protein